MKSSPRDRASSVKSSGHRRLTREELEIWQAVARSISPLHASSVAPHIVDLAPATPEVAPPPRPLEPRRYDTAGYTPPEARSRDPGHPPALHPLERRLRQKLRRGRS